RHHAAGAAAGACRGCGAGSGSHSVSCAARTLGPWQPAHGRRAGLPMAAGRVSAGVRADRQPRGCALPLLSVLRCAMSMPPTPDKTVRDARIVRWARNLSAAGLALFLLAGL